MTLITPLRLPCPPLLFFALLTNESGLQWPIKLRSVTLKSHYNASLGVFSYTHSNGESLPSVQSAVLVKLRRQVVYLLKLTIAPACKPMKDLGLQGFKITILDVLVIVESHYLMSISGQNSMSRTAPSIEV